VVGFVYASIPMTPNSPESPVNPQPPKKSNNLLIGFLVGCGCLSFGVVVLGVLASISLPSFLNQVGRARTSEATSNTGTILRAQQAYFLDKGKFANSFTELDAYARVSGKYYKYKTMRSVNGVGAVVVATPVEPNLPGVVGVAYTDKAGSKYTFQICVSEQLSPKPPTPPKPPSVAGGTVTCPPGSKPVN
jgi:type IV pilus assembly protein PilA